MDNLAFEGGWGGGGGGRFCQCERFFPQLINKEKYFSSRKAIHNTEFIERELFSCFRAREKYALEVFQHPSLPQSKVKCSAPENQQFSFIPVHNIFELSLRLAGLFYI